MDYVINEALELNLHVVLLPTWGDKINKMPYGQGPEIFDMHNAKTYGKWIGKRYRDYPNIIWVSGGDRPLYRPRHHEVIKAMAQGIKEGDEGRHLVSFHPPGKSSSSKHNHEEIWLDFNMLQSSHSVLDMPNYDMVAGDLCQIPLKPTLDSEPCYEDHPINFNPENGYFDDVNIRKAAYWSVFAGACGHTYGHHCVWSMCTEPTAYFLMTWKDALSRPGAVQMK